MRQAESVDEGIRYVLTDEGREALLSADTCRCKWIVRHGWIGCDECRTVLMTEGEARKLSRELRRVL